MKIVSTDATKLIASDKAFSQLIMAPIIAIVGIVALGIGIVTHQLIADGIGGFFVLIGIVMFLTRTERTLVVDKGSGQVLFSAKSILKKSEHPYTIQNIAKVQLATEYQTTTSMTNQQSNSGFSVGTNGIGGGGGRTETSQLTHLLLVLQDGTTVDLADGQRSMSALSIISHVPNQEVGQQIASFIGVPFEQLGEQSVGQVASAVINAVKGTSEAPSVVAPSPPTPQAPQPLAPVAPVVPPPVAPPQQSGDSSSAPALEPPAQPPVQPEEPSPQDPKPPVA